MNYFTGGSGNKKLKFAIRKLTIGAASIMIGVGLIFSNAQVSYSNTTTDRSISYTESQTQTRFGEEIVYYADLTDLKNAASKTENVYTDYKAAGTFHDYASSAEKSIEITGVKTSDGITDWTITAYNKVGLLVDGAQIWDLIHARFGFVVTKDLDIVSDVSLSTNAAGYQRPFINVQNIGNNKDVYELSDWTRLDSESKVNEYFFKNTQYGTAVRAGFITEASNKDNGWGLFSGNIGDPNSTNRGELIRSEFDKGYTFATTDLAKASYTIKFKTRDNGNPKGEFSGVAVAEGSYQYAKFYYKGRVEGIKKDDSYGLRNTKIKVKEIFEGLDSTDQITNPRNITLIKGKVNNEISQELKINTQLTSTVTATKNVTEKLYLAKDAVKRDDRTYIPAFELQAQDIEGYTKKIYRESEGDILVLKVVYTKIKVIPPTETVRFDDTLISKVYDEIAAANKAILEGRDDREYLIDKVAESYKVLQNFQGKAIEGKNESEKTSLNNIILSVGKYVNALTNKETKVTLREYFSSAATGLEGNSSSTFDGKTENHFINLYGQQGLAKELVNKMKEISELYKKLNSIKIANEIRYEYASPNIKAEFDSLLVRGKQVSDNERTYMVSIEEIVDLYPKIKAIEAKLNGEEVKNALDTILDDIKKAKELKEEITNLKTTSGPGYNDTETSEINTKVDEYTKLVEQIKDKNSKIPLDNSIKSTVVAALKELTPEPQVVENDKNNNNIPDDLELEKAAVAKKEEINQRTDLTEKEKVLAIQEVDRVKEQEQAKVDAATNDTISAAIEAGKKAIEAINPVGREKSKSEIEAAATAKNKEIEGRTDLTEAEKAAAKEEVEAKKKEALGNIDKATTNEAVTTAKTNGVSAIEAINPKATTKDLSIYENKAKALSYYDTSIVNMAEEGLYVQANLSKNYLELFKDVVDNKGINVIDLVRGVQIGVNQEVIKGLKLGVFAEYTNNSIYHTAFGVNGSYRNGVHNLRGFGRYRFTADKNGLINHNLDLYINYGADIEVGKVLLTPKIGIYGTYASKAKLDENVMIKDRFTGIFDISGRISYQEGGHNIYFEPRINVGINMDQEIYEQGRENNRAKVSQEIYEVAGKVGYISEIGNYRFATSVDINHRANVRMEGSISYNW